MFLASWAVKAMMGARELAPSRSRISRVAAKPSIPGMFRSIMIRSNRSVALRAMASTAAVDPYRGTAEFREVALRDRRVDRLILDEQAHGRR